MEIKFIRKFILKILIILVINSCSLGNERENNILNEINFFRYFQKKEIDKNNKTSKNPNLNLKKPKILDDEKNKKYQILNFDTKQYVINKKKYEPEEIFLKNNQENSISGSASLEDQSIERKPFELPNQTEEINRKATVTLDYITHNDIKFFVKSNIADVRYNSQNEQHNIDIRLIENFENIGLGLEVSF